MLTIEVFADVTCPFTHVGLRRFVERRAQLGRDDVVLRVRAWPLELVNGRALDASFVAEEIDEIRAQITPNLFTGFRVASFPATSLPALELAAAAHRQGPLVGEQISLELRDLLFEQGVDIADPDVLCRLARDYDIAAGADDLELVRADHREGRRRGVIGSPHFFTPAGGFFCPSLDVHRDADAHLVVSFDPDRFERFIDACFPASTEPVLVGRSPWNG